MLHPTAKASERVNRKCPWEPDFATFNLLRRPYPLKLPPLEPYIGSIWEYIKNILWKWTSKPPKFPRLE